MADKLTTLAERRMNTIISKYKPANDALAAARLRNLLPASIVTIVSTAFRECRRIEEKEMQKMQARSRKKTQLDLFHR